MFDADGNQTWSVDYDIYGKIRKQDIGNAIDCPFRYQGQYEDDETGLYYNRFRYYSAEEGNYISQDPIKINGGNNLYGYVHDCNSWVDIFGLNGLQELANQAHSVLPEGSQGRMVTAIGEDANGAKYISSSSP